jgi:hypothetical protein
MSLAIAIAKAELNAVKMSDVCQNPGISSAAKQTTAGTGVTDRWLAAQEVFNSIKLANMWSLYQGAFGSTGIRIIVDGKSYQGFNVTYADGSTEKWVVNPGNATSMVKLFDTPAPNSLKVPAVPKAGCGGTG